MEEPDIVHNRMISRLDSMKSSIDAFAASVEEQFRWLRQKLGPRGKAYLNDPLVADLKQGVLNPSIVLDLELKETEIKAELENQGAKIEADLVLKTTTIGTIKELKEKGDIGSLPLPAKVQECKFRSER